MKTVVFVLLFLITTSSAFAANLVLSKISETNYINLSPKAITKDKDPTSFYINGISNQKNVRIIYKNRNITISDKVPALFSLYVQMAKEQTESTLTLILVDNKGNIGKELFLLKRVK